MNQCTGRTGNSGGVGAGLCALLLASHSRANRAAESGKYHRLTNQEYGSPGG